MADAHVEDPAPHGELLVDGQRLVLREAAGEEVADPVGCRLVGARPQHLAQPHVVWYCGKRE